MFVYIVYSVLTLGIPLDLYHKIREKRLFGEGRSISGFFFYIFSALFVGILQKRALEAFYLGFGGVIGCFLSSFIKRRLGFKRGSYFFLLDQVDFIIGASLFYITQFELRWNIFIFGIFIAFILHHGVNLLRKIWEPLVKS